jgi:chitin disaccharide deacetylase
VSHNPALRELGFTAEDRVVIIHADDVGMCGATIDAFLDLTDHGTISAGSVMVPCPWFPQVASCCRTRADLDIGLHLTLTSEWDGYRWAPISTCDPACGLIDQDGYLHRTQDHWPHLDPPAIHTETHAQVHRALTAGLDLTHLDSHMFALLQPALAGQYVQLGFDHHLPVFMTRQSPWASTAITTWEEHGLPIFDHLPGFDHPATMSRSDPTAHWFDLTIRLLDRIPPGLSYLVVHPAKDTPELRAITPYWRRRVADYETFRDDRLARHLRTSGIQVIGWRPLRELLRRRRNDTTAPNGGAGCPLGPLRNFPPLSPASPFGRNTSPNCAE